jgi:hypothetical protein
MADILTSVTVIGTGVAANSITSTAETVTITVTDLSRTFVRATNVSTTASVILSVAASADPMVAKGIGALAITLTTAQTQYFGASWDSARLKSTAGTIVITVPTAGTATFEVGYMTPH